jgi:hypothetical protein
MMLDFYDSQPLSCLLRECYIWFSTRAGHASVTSKIKVATVVSSLVTWCTVVWSSSLAI